MNLIDKIVNQWYISIPRVSGGEPMSNFGGIAIIEYSPRERG